MINLGYNTSIETIRNSSRFKYYYVDEPFENVGAEVIFAYASNIEDISPSSKLLLSDYKWPENELCNFFVGNGQAMWYLMQYSNTYIMCDQYNGDFCGNAHDYWNEYKAYYGIPNKNFTNWISLGSSYTSDWGDLLNVAMAWSAYGAMNPLWIYGSNNNVDESRINQFCSTAWQTGWLLRLAKEYEIIWKCESPSPCTNCDWFNHEGSWYIIGKYYLDQQYFAY